MAEYNRLQISEQDIAELRRCKSYFPFREWFAVKAEMQECRFFDSKRKALNFAKKHAPAAIYGAQ